MHPATTPMLAVPFALAVLVAPADAGGRALRHPLTAADGSTVQLVPHTGPGLAPLARGGGALPLASGWTQASVPPNLFLRAISFATPAVGYAAGELGVVVKTTDGGATWTTVLDAGFPYYWYGVQATSAQSVCVSGFDNQTGEGIVRWSENGGATWGPEIVLPGPTSGIQWLDRVEFSSVSDGATTAAWSGGVHTTQSGGRNASDWAYTQVSGGWFNGTFTINSDDRIWLAGIDLVFSPDVGATWTPFGGTNAPFDGPIAIHDHGHGLTGGGTISPAVTGWIYRTENAGHAWTSAPVATLPYPVRGLHVLDATHAWAVGGDVFSGAGGIWSSTDGGQSFALDLDAGTELTDVDSIRIDGASVRVFVAGYGSQIWTTTIASPSDGGLIADSYGFCDPPLASCGNGYHNAGCANETGSGALLAASGTSRIGADDLVLTATQMPPFKPGLVFMGPGRQALPSGNGLITVAAGTVGLHRFPARVSDANGVLTQGPGNAAHSSAFFPIAAHIQPGQTWNFQCFYRDPFGPCGSTYNFSNGFAVTFFP